MHHVFPSLWSLADALGSLESLRYWQGADAALKAAKQGVAARDEKLRAMQRQLEAARGELEAARKAAAKAAPSRLKAVKEEEEYVDESPRVRIHLPVICIKLIFFQVHLTGYAFICKKGIFKLQDTDQA